MKKVKAFIKNWGPDLIKFAAYVLVEVAGSAALVRFLEDRIPDEAVYGVVIMIILTVRKFLKERFEKSKIIAVI